MSSDTTTAKAPDFTATVGGTARIGANRELKRAIESYWKGQTDRASLEAVAASLRGETARQLRDAGFDSIPVNTFSYYDQMLDTAIMLGALAPRFASVEDDLDRYFAAARGTAELTPLEMTKWFDTNYHYLVPELSAQTTYSLDASKVLAELAEATNLGVDARPVVIGPITFLALAKSTDDTDPLDRLDEVVGLYEELLGSLAEAGANWVQIDEPVLCTDIVDGAAATAGKVYERLSAVAGRPAIFVNTYFGDPGAEVLAALAATDIEAIGVDLVYGSADTVASVPALSTKLLVAGVVNGRNIWRTDLDAALATLGTLLGSARAVAVSTSCSTLHVPYSLEPETELDDNLRGWLAFAAEKFTEVAVLAAALNRGRDAVADAFEASAAALATRATDPRVKVAAVRERLAAVTEDQLARGESAGRLAAQQERLGLPLLPTTTIGSYPQTSAIRKARAALRAGEIDEAEYTRRMQSEIEDVIALQEDLGLDVLVHGEPERNDMVQYFAEQLDGFFATQNGWVQSYGTRCVRPPILFGDVVRPKPMTVDWITYAQSKTAKPVKGMLTGPVTILAWSFVRDDQPEKDSANQIALAIRDETVDLEKAGIGVIQVDEPALRELLPLRDADKPDYLRWAVDAFRLSTAGVEDTTQIHTHLCYSEFGEVIGAIADLDADVTSIEAARSAMEVLDDLNAIGFANGVGPGVYDIHSPRVPSTEEITASLQAALKAVPAERLWVNPDCGLKTRGNEEVTASLRNLVEAAKTVRPAATA
ncbi:5-methyltetrahydropteroyltriglutamate--homocysteine methyltransferase [Gordonia araii NBRC 100433]|uniref:5-methyltetrahydropteroyltriglutamate--homocysteine methyltransferase n=1 Tax=Gordonia araii NBRC 100433 TaxID=1073574 RepID=G7GYT7_9ACTN|nr:5-methyltetrahydropteroyltriglutamate--homocysteine S-methyltransferase [Gordonia araii]NNG98937.1 5-methyltetrahydropteroyltriglutamate--homocysteine S-methyltransferase [Gordonia araii NBRC 100433]GAB08762.1 5-methyltetrahydropteroyltriglutamate--homocysteine methyltransferase [Gordonia araii NBRC 100433]